MFCGKYMRLKVIVSVSRMRDFAKCKQFPPYDSSHMQYLLLCFEPVIYKRENERAFSLLMTINGLLMH